MDLDAASRVKNTMFRGTKCAEQAHIFLLCSLLDTKCAKREHFVSRLAATRVFSLCALPCGCTERVDAGHMCADLYK